MIRFHSFTMVNKWFGFLVFFLGACNPSGMPSNVMPVNTMKEVMWDVMQADAFSELSLAKDTTKNLKQETLKLYSKVFAKYKISNEDFKRSYNYYRHNPVMEKVLLDSLQLYGNTMREANFQKPILTLPVQPIINDTAIKN